MAVPKPRWNWLVHWWWWGWTIPDSVCVVENKAPSTGKLRERGVWLDHMGDWPLAWKRAGFEIRGGLGSSVRFHNWEVIDAWGAVSLKWWSKSLTGFKGKGKHSLGFGNHNCRQLFWEGSPVDFSNSLLSFTPSQYRPLPVSVNILLWHLYFLFSDAISLFPLLVEYTKDLEGWTVVMPDTLGHRKTGRRAFQREGT